jgi:hypothetical protein
VNPADAVRILEVFMRSRRFLRTVVISVAALAMVSLAAVAVNAAIRVGHPDAEEDEAVTNNAAASTGSCGVERWSVKTGTDADRAAVDLQSTSQTTIAALGALTAPSSLPSDNRVAPTEDTVFLVHATLTEFKLEADSDYHLVLSDGSGHTMIAEIPDPACVGSTSVLTSGIQNARNEFNARFTPTTSFQTVNVAVTVRGVGFFDFLHGQTGVAPNGIELHAVLDVQFGSGSSNTVTVTTPGAQSTAVGTSTSLQIHASDSASGQTLSYSAGGLPAGLAISSTTGLISGTPTSAGSSTVTVSAADTTGATGSVSFMWTVTSGSACTGGGQLLGNPGFENGSTPWTATSGVISNNTSEPARTGSFKAWLDGYGSSHTDTLAQTVSVPAGCTSYGLSFWLHIDTAETTTTTKFDTLTVAVLNSSGTVLATLATYSNLDHNTGYAQRSFSLAAYAGQTITLKFTGTEDSTLQTSFVIDDTSLTVS